MNSIKKDLTYSDAMKRLEEIVRKIESGEMDIDSLAENLKEAKQLVAFCKGKLQHVEDEVNKLMEGKE